MITRRAFIRNSALAAGSLSLGAACTVREKESIEQEQQQKNLGLQLYTLRDQVKEDLPGTLKKVADIGYTELELFSYTEGQYFGKSVQELKKMLDDQGLTSPSGHYLTGNNAPDQKGTPINEWQMAIDDAKTMGHKYMVIAYLMDFERKNMDDYYAICDLLNAAGEKCKASNIQLCYHNHAFEFDKFDDKIAYDEMLRRTDADLVKMELDHYWIVKAGYDSLDYFAKHPGRFPLWHVKDMNDAGDFTEVGTGTIDYAAIFAKAEQAGLDHFFIEQDRIAGDHFKSVTTSFGNVEKLV